jgi:ribosome-binding protein aMBF1 (putative translation factor)
MPLTGRPLAWKCSRCSITLEEPCDATDREPDSDGDQDVVAATMFGGRVRAQRIKRGLSQLQLAALVGAHWSLISAIENGEVSPRLRTVLRLSRALSVDPGRAVEHLPAGLPEPQDLDLR